MNWNEVKIVNSILAFSSRMYSGRSSKKIKFKRMKYLLILSLLTYSLCGYTQVKSYYIDNKGKKVSECDAFYKRTVEKKGKNWKVIDMYLNDTIQMIGTYTNRGLSNKTGEFHYYYVNGKSQSVVNYKNNLKEGIAYSYNILGEPAHIRNYYKGELTGNYKKYDELGNLERDIDCNEIQKYYANPEYYGGPKALSTYLSSIEYPKEDEKKGYIANPIVAFTIDTSGRARNIDLVVKGTDSMNHEIKILIEKMPKWRAGIINGKKVEQTYLLPFNFCFLGYNARVKLKTKKKAKAFYDSAVRDYKNNEFKSAIAKLNEAVKNDHMNAKSYLLMGLCYYGLNNKGFAFEYWRIALALDNNILPAEIKMKLI